MPGCHESVVVFPGHVQPLTGGDGLFDMRLIYRCRVWITSRGISHSPAAGLQAPSAQVAMFAANIPKTQTAACRLSSE